MSDYRKSNTGTGYADHIGIVVSVSGDTIKLIEGNMSDAVGYRNIKVNGKFIRGYGVPNYAGKATEKDDAPKPSTPTTKPDKTEYDKGDLVQFTGCLHYTSSYSGGVAKACKAGVAKVTNIAKGNPHPYHLQAVLVKALLYMVG